MTTTDNHSATDQSASQETNKVIEWAKRLMFPIALIVIGIIEWIVLATVSMASNVYTFDLSGTIVIFIFGLAFFAWPTLKTIKLQPEHFVLRLGLIAAFALAPWLLFFPLFNLTLGTGFAGALWGLRIPGVVAIALHAVAAYSMSRFAVVDKTSERELEQEIATRESEISRLRSEERTHQAAEQAQQQVVERLEAEKGELSDQANKAGQEYKEYKEQRDEKLSETMSPLKERQKDLKERADALRPIVDTAKQQRRTLETEIRKIKVTKATLVDWDVKLADAEEALVELDQDSEPAIAELADLDRQIAELKAEIEELEAEAKDSDEQREQDRLKQLADDASEQSAAKAKEFSLAQMKLREMTDASAVRTRQLENLTGQLEEPKAKLSALSADSVTTRDVVVVPVVLMAVAIVLYCTWIGYIFVENGAPSF